MKFHDSKRWLSNFNNKFLNYWKTTKTVSRYQNKENATIEQCAHAFVNHVDIFEKDSQLFEDKIFNAYQTSSSEEIQSGRILDFVGSKHIESIAQSVSSMSYSCIIMPIISKGGNYYPLCLMYFLKKLERLGLQQ